MTNLPNAHPQHGEHVWVFDDEGWRRASDGSLHPLTHDVAGWYRGIGPDGYHRVEDMSGVNVLAQSRGDEIAARIIRTGDMLVPIRCDRAPT